MTSPRQQLERLLSGGRLLPMPCCYDALTASLVERAGFQLTFMSGFAVSAARLGLPDTGLISYGEMLDQGRNICGRVKIPVIGDADTGYGNELNVKRTIAGYAAAGFACAMIEDQLLPKRCGHTQGKQVVERREALSRIKAAVDAREEGADILIMARTDARATHGLEEALDRCRAFADLGADIIFLEAPESLSEMKRFCAEIPGCKMANMLKNGRIPFLSPPELEEMGFTIAAYPLTLLSAAVSAMQGALEALKGGGYPDHLDFAGLREITGFNEYNRQEERYRQKNYTGV
ncbi:MAG: isocitrate lyase/PEP mutase family protein [Deltaproteobacteria bacterium]|nr:isocitrate lyase/PEP mutase family protein [Deltaproteobacteria bacterium]